MSDRWIVIPKWDEFQHYKDRDPKWIKAYTRLLADPAYVGLSFPQRGLLHGLWHLYARSSQDVPDNTAYLSRQLGGKVLRKSLISLNHAGWIEFSSSKPLARVYQPASLEVRDRERKDLSAHAPNGNGAAFLAKVAADQKGREYRPYDPPRDVYTVIERQIRNGIYPSLSELEAELDAQPILSIEERGELRALLSGAGGREAANSL